MRPMVRGSLDDDPRFKVNGAFNGENVQVYYMIGKLINFDVRLSSIGRNVQVMHNALLIAICIRWNNQ